MKFLDKINCPEDLKKLNINQLIKLSDEVREFLINTVSQSGGHLSSNLGSIELTIALHYVFNTPNDKLIWDVGHQTYTHKILTGRKNLMKNIRKYGGISGFPRREESLYDVFGTAHSSTSISAALGMSIGAMQNKKNKKVVAIIGDGAMTAGLAFEALNNAGATSANVMVVLNDNDMSISENVGALNNYLARLLSGRFYSAARKASEKVLEKVPSILELARKTEEHVKGMVMPSTLFEEFGFNYIGPIDGHNIKVLVKTLSNIRKLSGPQFLHVVTKKGKGYIPAEKNPILYHGVSTFDPKIGIKKNQNQKGENFTDLFSEWICEKAKDEKNLIAITPAMREGSGLVKFSQKFPDRYFDVGIAEQHALTFAAGLSCEGLRPVVAIYSTFLQRGFDQLIHDICIQNLNIIFAIDRAGLVGADGATHHGVFDLSYLRCLPNMTILAPADKKEFKKMLDFAFEHNGPIAIRYPKDKCKLIDSQYSSKSIVYGKSEKRRLGNKVAILVFGSLLDEAQEVAERIDATLINMRFVCPIDENLIDRVATNYQYVITIEENVLAGGAGSAILEYISQKNFYIRFLRLGIPNKFVDHGDRKILLRECGLDAESIYQRINNFIR